MNDLSSRSIPTDPFSSARAIPSLDTVAFMHNRLDRDTEQREEGILATMLTQENARFYLFHKDHMVVRLIGETRTGLFNRTDAETLGVVLDKAILLGTDPECGNAPRIAVPVAVDADSAIEQRSDLKLEMVRDVGLHGLLPLDELGAVAQAYSLLNWHENHQFCAKCGQRTTVSLGGARRDCPSCEAVHFPRTDPAAIMLAIHRDEDGIERCLLAHHTRFATRIYTTLAGFIEQGEPLESAVRREVFEEAGIRVGAVRYLASQPWPFPSSLMLGCHAEALTTDLTIDTTELTDARWLTREEVREMMARDYNSDLPHIPGRFTIARWLITAWVDAK